MSTTSTLIEDPTLASSLGARPIEREPLSWSRGSLSQVRERWSSLEMVDLPSRHGRVGCRRCLVHADKEPEFAGCAGVSDEELQPIHDRKDWTETGN